jgi:hypothetical protein
MRRSPLRPPRPPRAVPERPRPPGEHAEPVRYYVTESERSYRRTHQGLPKLKPAYAHLINLANPGSGRMHARRMVLEIERLLDHAGWSDSEAQMLYEARDKWRRRQDGLDARYLLVGTRRGRLPRWLEDAAREHQLMIDLELELRKNLADYKAGRIPGRRGLPIPPDPSSPSETAEIA